MKLPKRENLIGPILHHPPHLSLASLNIGCLSMGQVPIPDPISYDCSSQVAWPPMHEEVPRTTAERNGGQAYLLPPEEAVGGAGSWHKDCLSKSKFLEKEAVSLISYLHNVLVLFLNKENYVK